MKINGEYKAAIYIPFFPGFYGTVFESNDDIVSTIFTEDIKECLEIKNLNDDKLEDAIERVSVWDYFDNKEYEKDIGEQFVYWLNNEISDIEILKGFGFEYESIHHPKEYNFTTDKIEGYLNIPAGGIDRIIKEIESDEDFDKYCRENFSSYSGFVSFIPNNKKDFLETLKEYVKYDDEANFSRNFSLMVRYLIERELSERDIENITQNTLENVWEENYCNRDGYNNELITVYNHL